MSRKKEPDDPSLQGTIDVKQLQFGAWAICPKCRARPRKVTCKRCQGAGIIPNEGIIPFVKKVGA